MGRAAGRAHGAGLVVERGPVASQHVTARDDDVDLASPGLNAGAHFGEPLRKRRQTGGKAGRHGGNGNAGARKGGQRCRDHVVIDTDRTGGDRVDAESIENFRPHRMTRLGAKPAHPAGRVVACQRGQVDHGDGAQQPGCLVVFLDRPPPRQRCGAPLDGRGVGLDPGDPVQIQRHAGIARFGYLQRKRVADRGAAGRCGG